MSRQYNADERDIDLEQLPVIELDEREIAIAEHIAAARNKTHLESRERSIHGDHSSYDAQETGVLGEFATAKFLDGMTIFDIDELHEQGDPSHDLCLQGTSIDVKTTTTDLDFPDLIVPEQPEPIADRFILAHRISERRVRLIGMASRLEVTNHPIVRAPGTRRNYLVPPEDLTLFTR